MHIHAIASLHSFLFSSVRKESSHSDLTSQSQTQSQIQTNSKPTLGADADADADAEEEDKEEVEEDPLTHDSPLKPSPPLRSLSSLKWPYVPDVSSYPDPLTRDDPQPLTLAQYEAIGTFPHFHPYSPLPIPTSPQGLLFSFTY